jgi:hypothetical protein
MFNIFILSVNQHHYDTFVNTGVVPKWIIKLIAKKIIKQIPLNDLEKGIFYGKTTEINEQIKNK